MGAPDIHALVGAYVLDALPAIEQISFEHHLADCAACADEVNLLDGAVTDLSAEYATPPPPGLKADVLAAIAVQRQLAPLTTAAASDAEPVSPPATVRGRSRFTWRGPASVGAVDGATDDRAEGWRRPRRSSSG